MILMMVDNDDGDNIKFIMCYRLQREIKQQREYQDEINDGDNVDCYNIKIFDALQIKE